MNSESILKVHESLRKFATGKRKWMSIVIEKMKAAKVYCKHMLWWTSNENSPGEQPLLTALSLEVQDTISNGSLSVTGTDMTQCFYPFIDKNIQLFLQKISYRSRFIILMARDQKIVLESWNKKNKGTSVSRHILTNTSTVKGCSQ